MAIRFLDTNEVIGNDTQATQESNVNQESNTTDWNTPPTQDNNTTAVADWYAPPTPQETEVNTQVNTIAPPAPMLQTQDGTLVANPNFAEQEASYQKATNPNYNQPTEKDLWAKENVGNTLAEVVNKSVEDTFKWFTGDAIRNFDEIENEYEKIRNDEVFNRNKIIAMKASGGNTLINGLKAVWFENTGNTKGLVQLMKQNDELQAKTLQTLENVFKGSKFKAEYDEDGDLNYYVAMKDGWRPLNRNIMQEMLATVDINKAEMALGLVGGNVGAAYGKIAGKAINAPIQAAASKLKKLPIASKVVEYAGKGIEKLTTGAGTAIGSALGIGAGSIIDTLDAQIRLSQDLNFAAGIDNAEDAIVASAMISAAYKPAMYGVTGTSKLFRRGAVYLATGNLPAARAYLKAHTNMTDSQIAKFTDDFQEIYGNFGHTLRVTQETTALGFKPQNIQSVAESAGVNAKDNLTKFLSSQGELFQQQANKLVGDDLINSSELIKQSVAKNPYLRSPSGLGNTGLIKGIMKETAQADDIAKAIANSATAVDKNYYNSLYTNIPANLQSRVEGLVINSLLSKNTTKLPNGSIGIDFTQLSKDLAKVPFKSKEAKEYTSVAAGSAKYLDNSTNLLRAINKTGTTFSGSSITGNPIIRLKNFLANNLFVKLISQYLGENIAVKQNLVKLMNNPMEKKTWDDMVKHFPITQAEKDAMGKEFRENVARQQQEAAFNKQVQEQTQGIPAATQANIAETMPNTGVRQTMEDTTIPIQTDNSISTLTEIMNAKGIDSSYAERANDIIKKQMKKRIIDEVSKLGKGKIDVKAADILADKDTKIIGELLKREALVNLDKEGIELTLYSDQLVKEIIDDNIGEISAKQIDAVLPKAVKSAKIPKTTKEQSVTKTLGVDQPPMNEMEQTLLKGLRKQEKALTPSKATKEPKTTIVKESKATTKSTKGSVTKESKATAKSTNTTKEPKTTVEQQANLANQAIKTFEPTGKPKVKDAKLVSLMTGDAREKALDKIRAAINDEATQRTLKKFRGPKGTTGSLDERIKYTSEEYSKLRLEWADKLGLKGDEREIFLGNKAGEYNMPKNYVHKGMRGNYTGD